MTISETIEYLEQLKQEHGDIELAFGNVVDDVSITELWKHMEENKLALCRA